MPEIGQLAFFLRFMRGVNPFAVLLQREFMGCEKSLQAELGGGLPDDAIIPGIRAVSDPLKSRMR